jgi:nucleotide-binding universal stress UspA family protein
MPVVCATNLSEPSAWAAQAAAAIALRLGESLLLLGVRDTEHHLPGGPTSRTEARQRLEDVARPLRSAQLHVLTRMLEGAPADMLGRDGECHTARLLVMAAEGWGDPSPLLRAPVTERIAQLTQVPVLVVRREAALVDWAQGRRRLLVLVGVDDSRSSACAVEWLRELRRIGPCDVLATTVCSPSEERRRLGIHTPAHLEKLDPALRHMETLDAPVERVLLRELSERVGHLPGEGALELRLEPGYGRPADHLLHVAHARQADLVVVGTHVRGGLARLWHGSVSAGVLRHAEQSVVCVPFVQETWRAPVPPRTVLVPVDFSEASVRAISQARSLVRPGGRVHLLHVHRRRLVERGFLDHYGVLPEPPGSQEAVLRRLQALVPTDGGAPSLLWTMEGVTGHDVAQAICQATEREGVDLVCLGTSDARSHEDVLGEAVARDLVARCRRPVMILHA